MHLHTISDNKMNAHRARAQHHFNSDAQFRVDQHHVHRGTQASGGKEFVKHTLKESDNGQIKSYTSIFEYADGSKETFDGREWVKIPAPKPVVQKEEVMA